MHDETTRREMWVWVLGAPDPEMGVIETLLLTAGERVAYALHGGRRVHAGVAYRGEAVQFVTDCGPVGEPEAWMLVECAVPVPDAARMSRIDHHRPGDPGYGRPAREFLAASSLGQVLAVLGLTATEEHLLGAAADHCLGAAYAGRCPGVHPDALGRWRAETRARQQGRTVEDVLADVARAQEALLAAPRLVLHEWADGTDRFGQLCDWSGYPEVVQSIDVADMRRPAPVPELPEAATRLGFGYVSGPLVCPDGREKYTVSGSADQVRAFLAHWAPKEGLVDSYGDAERGFGGAYVAASGGDQ